MGLHAYIEETGTEAWYGSYSAFNRWRDTVAKSAGYAFTETKDSFGLTRDTVLIDWGHITEANLYGDWETLPSDPLLVLIAHSDCEGEIQPEHTGPLADRLESVLPDLPSELDRGHIGDWGATTRKFIGALREASKTGQKVEFA